MGQMDRKRMSNKYRYELDALAGEENVSTLDQIMTFANPLVDAGKSMYSASQVNAAKKKRAEANNAAKAAMSETNPAGPLHQKAQQLDQEATAMEAKVGITSPQASLEAMRAAQASKSGMPTWGWVLLGGVGILGAGLITYKLASGGHGRYVK